MLADQWFQDDFPSRNDPDRFEIVFMPVHHRGVQVKFRVIDLGKVDGCHAGKDSNQHDLAAFSCVLDGLPHGNDAPFRHQQPLDPPDHPGHETEKEIERSLKPHFLYA